MRSFKVGRSIIRADKSHKSLSKTQRWQSKENRCFGWWFDWERSEDPTMYMLERFKSGQVGKH